MWAENTAFSMSTELLLARSAERRISHSTPLGQYDFFVCRSGSSPVCAEAFCFLELLVAYPFSGTCTELSSDGTNIVNIKGVGSDAVTNPCFTLKKLYQSSVVALDGCRVAQDGCRHSRSGLMGEIPDAKF